MCAKCAEPIGTGILKQSLDALDAIGEAGMVVIPQRPTAEMIAEGARAGHVDQDTAALIFSRMVNAAP